MEPMHNDRIYAIIPIGEAHNFIKSNVKNGRTSLDGTLLTWDQKWNPETYRAMQNSPTIKLFSHKQTLDLMAKKEWYDKDKDVVRQG